MIGGYRWHVEPPEAIWQLRRYGITVEQFNAMLVIQKGRCAICGKFNGSKRLCVDHNHETGKVRGLLCDPCNKVLGFAHDDCSVLTNARKYLIRSNL